MKRQSVRLGDEASDGGGAALVALMRHERKGRKAEGLKGRSERRNPKYKLPNPNC